MNFLHDFSLSKYWHIITILLISLALRWILINQGGRYYFPDEVRYDYSKNIAMSILQKDYSKTFADLMVLMRVDNDAQAVSMFGELKSCVATVQ